MEKRSIICGVLILLLVCTASFATAFTEILYEATDLGGGRWQYDYKVSNIGLTEAIKKFAIRFDYDMYSNLTIVTPAEGGENGWQKVVFQPDEEFEVDGEYSAKGKNPGIIAGESVSGFSVSFDWTGAGTPGPQYYAIINPTNFEVVSSGWTELDPASITPEPATVILIGMGGIFVIRKWPKKNK